MNYSKFARKPSNKTWNNVMNMEPRKRLYHVRRYVYHGGLRQDDPRHPKNYHQGDLMKNEKGRIVHRSRHEAGKRMMRAGLGIHSKKHRANRAMYLERARCAACAR